MTSRYIPKRHDEFVRPDIVPEHHTDDGDKLYSELDTVKADPWPSRKHLTADQRMQLCVEANRRSARKQYAAKKLKREMQKELIRQDTDYDAGTPQEALQTVGL
jgi:hypothetical protein